ncbi:MAG: DUF1294 domain-containing protein [Candidatus Cyclonatronum sp.]|uniref:DUF1294 domain-containing protein n=1 Tax=Cyclonatronum sp. TaxID=3024185 RepID=UPI0025BD12AF|nr:DUF1294 domain-containing protein [Cyclonatronum sp.]MCH8487960.1 DUF1294 domain-containing protein [Cyclonatronum sp.]
MIVYKRIILIVLFVLLNLHGYRLMEFDKTQAVKQEWRIAETQLMLIAAAGGSAGIGTGMLLQRHKIRKPKFFIGVPLLLLLNLATLRFLMKDESSGPYLRV